MKTAANLVIRVTGGGTLSFLSKLTGSAHNAGKATQKLERGTKNLAIAFGTLGGVLGIRQMIEYSDTWTLINSRIKNVTESTEQAMHVQEELYAISQRTRNSMAATGVLYVRLAINADQLGRSQQDLLDVVEAVNAAVLVSGATGVEAAQSIRQISQAFGKGKLDGDEFRTVMEAMPLIQRAIADEMDVPIGALQDLAAQGKITAQIMIDAMLNARAELTSQLDSMTITFGQAMVMIHNALTRMIGILNIAFGVSAKFGSAIIALVKNLQRLVAAATATMVSLVAFKLAMLAWALVLLIIKQRIEQVTIRMVIMTAVESIRRVWQMVRAMRSWAEAMAIWNAVSGGAVKFAAVLLAAGAGIYAYRLAIKKITEATEEWANAESDLSGAIGEAAVIEDARLKKLREKTEAKIEDMIREGHQAIVLAGLHEQGQALLEIRFAAVNKSIEARRELTGNLLNAMLGAIRVEEQLALTTLSTEQAMEGAADAMKARMEIIERFQENLQRSFADTFHKVMIDGISNFKELFTSIKSMFFRLVADMAAAKMMQRVGATLTAVLSGTMGFSPEEIAARETAEAAKARALGHMPETGLIPGVQAVEIEGITITASKSLATQMAQYLGPVLAGFALGNMIGGMTTNRALGAGGGALSGAATGFMMGGPMGALVGGLSGLAGGLIGASQKRAEEAEKLAKHLEHLAMVTAANSLQLEKLKAAFEGDPIDRLTDLLATSGMLTRISDGGRTAVRTLEGLTPSERAQVMAMAGEMNITLLDEAGEYIHGSMTQLALAVQETIRQMLEFGRNLTDITSRQAAYNALFDVADSPQQMLNDTFEVLNQLAPELMAQLGLSNLNLDSPEARATLLAGLQGIFDLIMSGELTPELLGAFGDKNQLLDAILKVKLGLDEFSKSLTKVTTDFPRAMDIIYYEQRYGRYANDPNGNGGGTGSGSNSGTGSGRNGSGSGSRGWVVNDGIHIHVSNEEDGDRILEKVEHAAERKRSRGGRNSVGDEDNF